MLIVLGGSPHPDRRHGDRRKTHGPAGGLVDWYRSLNGNRWMVSYLLPMAIVAALSVLTVLWGLFSLREPRYHPLGDYPVQKVLNRVQGVDGPALFLNETLKVTAQKCNDSDELIAVQGMTYMVTQGTNVPRVTLNIRVGLAQRVPGCQQFLYENALPEKTTPGFWRLEGSEVARDGAQTQVKPYYSEVFQVLPVVAGK